MALFLLLIKVFWSWKFINCSICVIESVSGSLWPDLIVTSSRITVLVFSLKLYHFTNCLNTETFLFFVLGLYSFVEINFINLLSASLDIFVTKFSLNKFKRSVLYASTEFFDNPFEYDK